jgi:hypothetical protein
MLEKLNGPPSRIESAADLYDWDELVQEDRVHRLIYTDPAIFQAEMVNIFGAVWVYLGHESQIPKNDDYITVRLGLRPIILLRDFEREDPRAVQPLHPPRHHLCRKDKGSARIFTCPYHGWSYLNTGKLRAVPWPDGYACDFKESKFNVAQVPRVDSYRGFIFATLNPDAPPLLDYLGAITKPIDEWLDRQPKGKVRVCERTGSSSRATGSSPTTIPATAITWCSRTARSWRWRTGQADVANKGMSYYKGSPDTAPMYMAYMGNGHHFKDKRPNIEKRAGGLWAVEGPAPGTEHYQEDCAAATAPRPRDSRPRLLRARQHQRVSELLAPGKSYPGVRAGLGRRDQRHLVRHRGGGRGRRARRAVDDVNALRMRTQEQFPNFGEVDDLANFEEIQRGPRLPGGRVGLHAPRLGFPAREDRRHGIITAPATDEAFMREYIKEWKRLMKATPTSSSSASLEHRHATHARSVGQLVLRQRAALPRAGRELYRWQAMI